MLTWWNWWNMVFVCMCAESVNGYAIAIPVLLLLCAAGIAVFCVLHKKGMIQKLT